MAQLKKVSNDNMPEWFLNKNNDEIIDHFTKNPKEIKYVLRYGDNLLNFAIYSQNKEIFDWLLSNGAKLTQDVNGMTPIHQSTYSRDTYYLKALLDHGMKVDTPSKKQSTPFAMLIERIGDGTNGVGLELKKEEKIIKTKEQLNIFNMLLDNGADMYVEIDGMPAFLYCIKKKLYLFVESMIKKDKSLLKMKTSNYPNPLSIALSDIDYTMVDLLLSYLDETNASTQLILRFIQHTDGTDVAMKLYNELSTESKEELPLEQMMYVQGGEEKMLRLINKGVILTDTFIKDSRVIAIADKLLQTNRKEEIINLGVRNEVIEFYPQEAKDVFLF